MFRGNRTLLTVFACWILVTGCARNVPRINYYHLMMPERPPHKAETPSSYSLAIPSFESTAALANSEIAYMPQPYEIDFYGYHQWVAPPAQIINERIRDDCYASGLFMRITSQSTEADLVLHGFVTGFHEEDGPTAFGILSIELELENPREAGYLWHKHYSYRIPAADRSPRAVVIALNEAMTQLGTDLINDLRSLLADR